MKISFVVPGLYFKSGGLRIIFEYANRLHDKGHDVIIYNPLMYYNFFKGEFRVRSTLGRYRNSVRDLVFGVNIPKNFYEHNFKIVNVPFISNLFLGDADIVIATAWPTAYSVFDLNKSKGKKIYFIQDYESWNANIEYVDKSYLLPLKRITISKYLRKLFEEKFHIDTEVIYNGIDFNKFNNEQKVFNTIKRISFIYHDLEKKDSEAAIKTVVRLKEKYPDIEIISFGYNAYKNMPDFVKFYVNPNDELIKNIYCMSDIFLFTSKEEGFGLPPAEAMGCKCAVVTTNVGAIPEYSIPNISAIHTNPQKPDELFYGACSLLENIDKLKDISFEGHRMVTKLLKWDDSIEKFEYFIHNI